MWTTRTSLLAPSTVHHAVEWRGGAVTMREAFALLQTEPAFVEGLAATLCQATFSAFYWETPAVSEATADLPFEFVLLDAPTLARIPPNPAAFREHFGRDDDGDGVVVFDNLGRDATLVVPCPVENVGYPHLAAFVRKAPATQVGALFRAVGEAASRRLSSDPRWLSTAGLGVAWLHVRIDSRPKYYRHRPYTTERRDVNTPLRNA